MDLQIKRPSWLSKCLAERMSDRDVQPLEGERKAFRRRAKMRPSVWAERYRILPPKVSSKPGKWRNATTPYLQAVMDVAALPFVREIVCCKGPQMGVTEAVHNFVGYSIDRAPGPVMYVFPDEDMARENMRDRIEPMISATPQLRRYLTGSAKDATSLRVDLKHVNVYLAWARSASKLGNKPIRYLSLDEIDKYPETSGKKEASPIALAEARTRTYSRTCKIFKYSTPTDESGEVWREINSCPVVLHYEARCPACGRFQRMVWAQVKWEGGGSADPDVIERQELARYECEHCGYLWDNSVRDEAVRAGRWCDTDGRSWEYAVRKEKPRKIGFHMPSWLSHFVSLSTAAAKFIEGTKDRRALRNFLNNFAAEPWVEYDVERSEDRILALKDERPAGLVPEEADVIMAGIDTQDDGFWYEIRAFRYGMELESWQVRAGFVDSLAGLDDIVNGTYKKPSGISTGVSFGLIDSQGHRTAEVYDWCRLHPRIYPLKGEQSMNVPFMVSGKSISKYNLAGLKLVRINTTYFKDDLKAKLEILPTDPGAWHMCADYPDDYARHMTSEYRDEKGKWQCPRHKPNHLWDCSVYLLAAAEIRHLKTKTRPGTSMPRHKKTAVNPYTHGAEPFARKQ
jgi:phage terminase large subunit GpA-like protein